MEFRDLLRFRHCDRTVYVLDGPGPAGPAGPGLRCPVCGLAVRLGLMEAPVRIQSPVRDGHRAACCLLVTSRDGAAGFREGNQSELHVGVSSSEGEVFSYTESGVQRQQQGWEQSVVVPLAAPSGDTVGFRKLWDEQLETYSRLNIWTADRFQEERDFGSCCYGFALSFINHAMRPEGKEPISRERFTSQYILPRLEAAARYLSVLQHIWQQGHCSTERDHGLWTNQRLGLIAGNTWSSRTPAPQVP